MAVTIDKVGGSSESKHAEIFGKSTEKPTTDINVNDIVPKKEVIDDSYPNFFV